MSTVLAVPEDFRCAMLDQEPILVLALVQDPPDFWVDTSVPQAMEAWYVDSSGKPGRCRAEFVSFGWHFDPNDAVWVAEWSDTAVGSEFKYSHNLFDEEETQEDDDSERVSRDVPDLD
jgi:hypothetical protein